MATYIKFDNNDTLYAATFGGRMRDGDWDDRASKFIHIELTYDEVKNLFHNDMKWSIIQDIDREIEEFDEETQQMKNHVVIVQEVYDNSEYSILGDITLHNDGTVTIKMGKPTAAEKAEALEAAVNMLLMPDIK